ncbi:hypothetical protein DFA_07418 [Cavenderia fasciculata]|uniref:Calcineurin-like phosphoesterase domain-containing protein n=1 Tax=Cavenderia fasciculata TaxID=261658 RepID=F4PWD1_CACFS|nr:uncharacterized protein DFA_07418 [Cavenderia fasciculata]EGG20295.1 hypothetical protein DFA_07418 [Cavenderia fasciculata]|eukprot:XP_004367278.1 hypothetical protein DFA_07418 [Cavenderia fasciculata]
MTEYSAQMVLLGDPQMEGDHKANRGLDGRYNVWFNDNYFRHIVSNIDYYLAPSHVVVLGDLFSSQNLGDNEFNKRVGRYSSIFEPLRNHHTVLINVTGNHDIGYGNEASKRKITRFENAFGRVNDKWFIGGHIFAVFNSMVLDDTPIDTQVKDETWQFLRDLAEERKSSGIPIVLATHIPLFKNYTQHDLVSNPTEQQQPTINNTTTDESQPINNEMKESSSSLKITSTKNTKPTIVDHSNMKDSIPFHFNAMCIEPYIVHRSGDHIKEQTMLSQETTQFILDELQPEFIVNGHDHDGCIYRHNNKTVEYTIRSMMGGFGGYSALFEIHPNDEQATSFSYSYKICPFVETKYINISFGVSAAIIGLFLLFNLIRLLWYSSKQLYQYLNGKKYISIIILYFKSKKNINNNKKYNNININNNNIKKYNINNNKSSKKYD